MCKINLPIELHNRRILIAGAGGGWDVFGGLPLAYHWQQTGCEVVLANLSAIKGGFDVRLAALDDHPEGTLSGLINTPVYLFGKEGFAPLLSGYQSLIKSHGIDTIVLVDGGVDSLMRGDEEGPGTIWQDSLSLGVVDELNVPTKILACVGFGTETEEGVCHYRALENIAAITQAGGFLGSCALTKEMEAFQYYEAICRQAFAVGGGRSHIHTRIIPAVHGEFGRYEMYNDQDAALDLLADMPPFVSPLMPIIWLFDVHAVASRNILIPAFRQTQTYADVDQAHMRLFTELRGKLRPNRTIPL